MTLVRGADVPSGRTASIVVAASNAPAVWRSQADYTSLATAITAAAAGDVILLSPGTHSISAAQAMNDAGVTLRGSGYNSTTVQLAASSNCVMFNVTADHVAFEDLTIDANGTNQGAGNWDGVVSTGDRTRFRYVWITNPKRYGILFNSGAVRPFLEWVLVSGAGSEGIYTAQTTVYDAYFRHVEVSTSTLNGINWGSSSARFIGCSLSDNINAGLLLGASAAQFEILGGFYNSNEREGIKLTAGSLDNGSIIGAKVFDNGEETDNTYSNILLSAGADDVIIMGCGFASNDAGAGNGPKYNIEASDSDNCIVMGNNLVGGYPGTGAISFVGNNNRIDEVVVEHFQDVLAASQTYIRNNEDLSAGLPITFTITAQPDVPRTVEVGLTHAQITAYTIVVTGTDPQGKAITESFTQVSWDAESTQAFATITSIQMTARTGTGVGDIANIGIKSKVGLAKPIYAVGDVFKVKKNNANLAAASYTAEATYDTVDLSTGGAITGGDDFTIWYKSSLNILA